MRTISQAGGITEGFLLLPRLTEKALDEGQALGTEHAGVNVAAVVEGRVRLQQVDPATGRAGLFIRAAEHHPVRPAMHDRPGTHRTGFLGNVKRAALQAPVPHRLLRGRQGQHFRMRGGILKRLHLVPGPRDHPPLAHDHAADGHFRRLIRPPRLTQRLAHPVIVVRRGNDVGKCHDDSPASKGGSPGLSIRDFSARPPDATDSNFPL
ncbi:MAG: hypothetical protein RLZ97_631 [Verrucomicrobiota bacterium]